jgi:hypothetical protein
LLKRLIFSGLESDPIDQAVCKSTTVPGQLSGMFFMPLPAEGTAHLISLLFLYIEKRDGAEINKGDVLNSTLSLE